MLRIDGDRTPGFKLFLTIIVGLVLTIPLFSVYLLAWDRESQSREAAQSITSGWGASQAMAGPVLVIPYRSTATETVVENGKSVTRTNEITRELTLAPEAAKLQQSSTRKPGVAAGSIAAGASSDCTSSFGASVRGKINRTVAPWPGAV